MATVQAPVPVQAPLQPRKTELLEGVGVSVTLVFTSYIFEHVLPQLIPAGLDVIVPVPVPVLDVVSVYCLTKFAVTLFTAVISTKHLLFASIELQPDQELNLVPESGVAVK
jgi:hypothetical protein